jgi:hypothetical protein
MTRISISDSESANGSFIRHENAVLKIKSMAEVRAERDSFERLNPTIRMEIESGRVASDM